ncbi:MAG: branched-chain amino acid aminotransferase [Saccharofermentanales bacterium]
MKPEITVDLTLTPKAKPLDESGLGFGQLFTDHMFIMDYAEGQGWHDPRIVPYAPLVLDPSTMVFHYGQAIFEGLKAYRTATGEINLFRPIENMRRINVSNERMVIPPIDADFCVECLRKLVNIDRDWVPGSEGTSLYIRPFIISTDAYLGVRPSRTFKFMIIMSPSGPYYPQGLNPVNIYVENEYVRAVKGGTGFAKTPGNYAASLASQAKAYKAGYVQVLWLDGIERKYIEEVGSMNVFFVIDGKITTPSLNGSTLPGITRKTVIELCRSWDLDVDERQIPIEEVFAKAREGRVSEVFGSGTAAVISPVGELRWNDDTVYFNNNLIGPLSLKLYNSITGIQYGKIPDEFGWIVKVG